MKGKWNNIPNFFVPLQQIFNVALLAYITFKTLKNMKTETKTKKLSAPTTVGLGGAVRQAAVLLLAVMMMTTLGVQTARADSAFSGGDGSEGDPYRIKTTADLNQLATDVNGGNTYSGTYFKMTADIAYAYTTAWNDATSTESNYTAIGCCLGNISTKHHPFSGTFDGDGHTVSGIRIYKNSGNVWTDSFQGLFGYVENGTVRNVTVADARITGEQNVGGIAGWVYEDGGTSLVENCHVLGNVAIHAVADNSAKHGGIAGSVKGTVSRCTSAVTLTVKDDLTGCESFGGIVGSAEGSTLRNNIAIGCTVPAVRWAGAIIGFLQSGDTEYNYYSNCTVDTNASNIGYGGNYYDPTADITTDPEDATKHPDGAVPLAATMLSETAAMPALNSGDEVAFYREFTWGKASTICLPFDYTPAAGIGTFYVFAGVNAEKTEVTMQAANTAATPLTANTPYLFMPTTGAVVFQGKAGTSTAAGTATVGDWQFKGTYATIEWTTDPQTIYGFASGVAYGGASDATEAGTFIRVHTGGIRPFRAYLQYTGSSGAPAIRRGGTNALPETMTVRLVGNLGQTTAIGTLDTRTGDVTFGDWYTMDGRRLSGKPSQKGLYIHNGRKEVLK